MGKVRYLTSVLALSALATVLVACGSSSRHGTDPVVRAADVTARVPGYRLDARMTMTTPAGPMTMNMTGVFDRAERTGQLTATEALAGHRFQFTEVFSGLTFYLRTAGLPQIARLTAKPWVKFDMSRMLGAMGLGSLPTGTDPSQFVDYLRAVASSEKRVGAARVRGVPTTHYHATIDLSRYTQLVPASQRAAAKTAIATLESAIGGRTMPIDAWIGSDNLVRRVSLTFPECVLNQHLRLAMTMDLYDYGPQKPSALPASGDAYDLTPLLSSSISKIKFGCSS